MIYGLNGIYSSNRVNWSQTSIEEASIDFTVEDRESLVESVLYSIDNDNNALFEYCLEYSDPRVLQESLSSIGKGIVKALTFIKEKIKSIYGTIKEALKKFLARIKFRTDKNGKMQNPVSKQYKELIDLADEELSGEIDVPSYNIKDSPIDYLGKTFDTVMTRAHNALFMHPADIERFKSQEKDAIDNAMKDLAEATSKDLLKTEKKNKLSMYEIKSIIEGASYNADQLDKIIKSKYDQINKDIDQTINDISKSTMEIESDNLYDKNGNKVNSMSLTADQNEYNKLIEYANKIRVDVSKQLQQAYNRFSSAVETYIVQCCTAKKQLEEELLKKQKPEA